MKFIKNLFIKLASVALELTAMILFLKLAFLIVTLSQPEIRAENKGHQIERLQNGFN